ncbi:MAG: hypothetical protein B6I26_06055 [Desulfobacteraceae bacterium 4572_130]|nr:MAG: hypothetical protein B6I26_06055 [Desulfobacteraceae bacterium 4572_130]
MRLPRFEYLKPENLNKLLQMLAIYKNDAKILAGGTDLLVRMKKGLLKPKFVISLKDLKELSYIKQNNENIKIGAKTCIADIIDSNIIKNKAYALFQACQKIGAATIQHYKGTIGGNILQDNRCIHYNQSAFHRSGRGACHKDGGKICYARDDADRCFSTCQSDGATALMALDAKLSLAKKGKKRTINLADFYTSDGIIPFIIEPDEILTEIIIPIKDGVSFYKRLSCRSSIDYPIVSAGVFLKPLQKNVPLEKNTIDNARIVVGAIGRSPLFLSSASLFLKGKKFNDINAFKKASNIAMDNASTFAVHNIGSTTLEYRCSMIFQMVFQALEQAVNLNQENQK